MSDAVSPRAAGFSASAILRPNQWMAWLDEIWEAERERWPIWVPVLQGIGVALYFMLRLEPPLVAGAAVFGIAALAALAFRRRPALGMSALAVALIAGGFFAAELRTLRVEAPILQVPLGPARISGRVAEVELLVKSARILLTDVSIDGLAPDATPTRIRVRLTPYSDVPRLGSVIDLRAKLFPPPVPAAPGAHDFRRDLFYQRIGGVGYAVRRYVASPAGAEGDAPRLGVYRQAVAERISAVLAGPDQAAERAIALALLVGERGPIPEATNNAMRDAGLAHLLAISGMNITIAAGFIYFVLRFALATVPWVALRFPIKKWAAAGGLIGAIAYTEFVGAPVSAERSMITTSFIMLAVMLDRSALTLRLVAISATLLILVEPEAIMGPSFQMSYAAIVALVVLYERWRQRGAAPARSVLGRATHYLIGIAVMSVVASAATAVFAIYHFQQSAFYGLGANLVAVPIHDLWIMPWGLATYALIPFGLEAFSLHPMAWGIRGMLATARLFSSLPGATGHFEAMPPAALGCIVLGGLWFLLWLRSWRWLGLAAVATGIVLTLAERGPDILIAADGNLVAVKLPSGSLAYSSRSHDRFTQSVWSRRAGDGDIEGATADFSEAGGADGCGKSVCRLTVDGHAAAIVAGPGDLQPACREVEIVISHVPAHADCRAAITIDSDDVRRGGAMSVTFGPAGPRVRSVNEVAGSRPWSARQPVDQSMSTAPGTM